MPSVFTHALVGLGIARISMSRPMPWGYYAAAAALSMLPDVDVIAFFFGIPYGARLGHRGFAHSLFCAVLISWVAAMLLFRSLQVSWYGLWLVLAAAMASHGLLDACTNGGMGIALLGPFDPTRYFFAWRPIQVSPIGLGFFSRWGMRALLSEIAWVWLPTAAIVTGVVVYRMRSSGAG